MDTVIIVATETLRWVLQVYYYLLFARAILSFLHVGENALTDFVYGSTELLLAPVRKITDRFMGGSAFPLDLSYLVVLVLITILLNIL